MRSSSFSVPPTATRTGSPAPPFCLGPALAREELRIALDHLLERLPGLELTVEEVAWQPTIDFRGPLSLPVRWRPAAARAWAAGRGPLDRRRRGLRRRAGDRQSRRRRVPSRDAALDLNAVIYALFNLM